MLLLGILAFTLSVPVIVDILVSVQGIYEDLSAFWLGGMFLISFFGMLFGVVLFAVYYRHYYSKNAKAIIIYSTIFAVAIILVSSFTFYQMYLFSEDTLQLAMLEIATAAVSAKLIYLIHNQSRVSHFQLWILSSLEWQINELSKTLNRMNRNRDK